MNVKAALRYMRETKAGFGRKHLGKEETQSRPDAKAPGRNAKSGSATDTTDGVESYTAPIEPKRQPRSR